jgi:hypothetical protein
MLRDHWREFPRELSSIEEIPAVLRTPLETHLATMESLIHLYLVPQPRGFWEWLHDAPPRNTVFLLRSDQIVIARERPDGSAGVESFALRNVIAVEVGTILLNSWLNLTVADSHTTQEHRLEYGTIFERTFRDSILWLRMLTGEGSPTTPHHQWRMPGEEHIKALPIKFNNAARNYWLDGESVLATCFVKPLSVPGRVIKRLQHNCSCATALVVSDREVCVITEQAMSGAGRWGQSWRFCPLSKITTLEIVDGQPFPHLLLSLCADSPQAIGDQGARPLCDICVPFDPDQRSEIARLIEIVAQCRKTTRVAA